MSTCLCWTPVQFLVWQNSGAYCLASEQCKPHAGHAHFTEEYEKPIFQWARLACAPLLLFCMLLVFAGDSTNSLLSMNCCIRVPACSIFFFLYRISAVFMSQFCQENSEKCGKEFCTWLIFYMHCCIISLRPLCKTNPQANSIAFCK